MRARIAFALLLAACHGPERFACDEDLDCDLQVGGRCEPSRACSYIDTGCTSQRRYGASAGALANACTPLRAEDILMEAHASQPFADQENWLVQAMGAQTTADEIPEDGIYGAALPNGDTIRFGKTNDPTDPTRLALLTQLAPDDPVTSGGLRVEIDSDVVVTPTDAYWIGVSIYANEWAPGSTTAGFGARLLSRSPADVPPVFALETRDGDFWVSVAYDVANPMKLELAEQPLPFGRWIDVVFQFRQGTSDAYLRVWMDGQPIVNHTGMLGFDTPGYDAYAKFGNSVYGSFPASRQLLLRSPVLVADPTEKYTQEDVRAFLQQN